MTAPPDDTDLHAVITALQAERDAALAREATLAEGLATRNSEYGERIEQQSATIDVLKMMSASPGDAQPILDLIVRHVTELCNVPTATLFEYDGELVHVRSAYRAETVMAASSWAVHLERLPMRPTRGVIGCRAILDRQIIHVRDLKADRELDGFVRALGHRSQVSVPLIRDGTAIGVISIGAQEPGGFSDSQIELLKTFAEQAVIAITSAETYRALQTRTSDLQETLEYQTATSDVLKVISRSAFDLRPVLDTVVETAARLCTAEFVHLALRDGDVYRPFASFAFSPEFEQFVRQTTFTPGRGSVVGRVLLEARLVHVSDITTDPEYAMPQVASLGNVRSLLGVPLLREGTPIGVFALGRHRAEPFTDRQIELVSTFADQAVIAIENTRLITEQREALEQQTATAEVLQVINASPGNLAPVFETLLDRAMRLCQANFGILATFDGECLRRAVVRGVPARYADYAVHKRVSDAPDGVAGRILRGASIVHVPDLMAEAAYRNGNPDRRALVELGGARTCLSLALRKDDALLGMLSFYRQDVRPFSDGQIALLENFADQAVIAMENARLLTETREALEQQTATAEVLQVINSSPGDLAPVFEAMLEKAMRLCEAVHGDLTTYDGERFHTVALRGAPVEYAQYRMLDPPNYGAGTAPMRILAGERFVHIVDLMDSDLYRQGDPNRRALVDLGGARSLLNVPLLKDSAVLGAIMIYRHEVRPFSDKQIALLQNFAAQAVIAMENARLLTETREALEQQTATAEVLQVINASPGNLAPVFDAMLERALHLCEAAFGVLWTYDGERIHAVALRGMRPAFAEFLTRTPHSVGPDNAHGRLLRGELVVHIADLMDDEAYRSGDPMRRSLVELGSGRTLLAVPLRKDEAFLGDFVIYRQEVRPFSDKQIALLKSFAAQAVIAMENARLLDEIRRRQEELRVTFENMGDGVAMFDETPRLVAWNRKFQEIFDVPGGLLEEHRTYADYIRYLAERGDYGRGADAEEQVRRITEVAGQHRMYERIRPDGRVIEIRHNPVAGGGFVLIYADITERKRSEAEIRAARDAAEEASRTIEAAYRELKAAQANLIQAEKMASLGQLTAGIAHEIKNPLNFVNNFSALSTELIDELRDVLAPEPLGETARTEVDDLTALLKGNLEKVVQHGQRADGIVRSMLDHSRGSSGERRMVDLNALIDEALNLAYHGARAQDQSFNITLERDFGEGISPIEVNPQDITRVFLNLYANGFYAVTRRARSGGDAGFVPTLKVSTRDAGEAVEIRVRDNGTGIPADIRDKLFQPFFTTKPTGEGTGLGLSITYDIVTQQHGGNIAVDSRVGEYSEFTIRLPRNP